MKLVIDLGNTYHKLAVFSDNDIIHFGTPQLLTKEILNDVIEHFPISSAILSSVINHDTDLELFIKSKSKLVIFNHLTPIPLKNKYQTPETLGNDRLAAAVCAGHLYPCKNVLVIDAGTCIKYDFVNSHMEYLGGAISPGLQMRFQALHTFTGHLPLIDLSDNNPLTGINTTESILSGVINGILAEINGIIDRYKVTYPEIQVVLSGGDAEYLVSKLKNEIFAVSSIVLKGLKIILDYNDNQKAT